MTTWRGICAGCEQVLDGHTFVVPVHEGHGRFGQLVYCSRECAESTAPLIPLPDEVMEQVASLAREYASGLGYAAGTGESDSIRRHYAAGLQDGLAAVRAIEQLLTRAGGADRVSRAIKREIKRETVKRLILMHDD